MAEKGRVTAEKCLLCPPSHPGPVRDPSTFLSILIPLVTCIQGGAELEAELLRGWVKGGLDLPGLDVLHPLWLKTRSGLVLDGVVAAGTGEAPVLQEALHRVPAEPPCPCPHVALAEVLGREQEGEIRL